MALANGAIDGALLFPAAGSSGARLRFGSSYRWAKIRNEVHRRYGWYPDVTSAGDGYRPLEVQERIFFQRYSESDSGYRGSGHIKFYRGKNYYIRKNPLTGRPYAVAATPGSSNHGWAKAVDVDGLTSMVLVRWAQFADVAPEFGFSNAEGHSIGEAWHWVDTLDPDVAIGASAPTTTEDDDMPTAAELWNAPLDDPNDRLPAASAYALLTGARQDAGEARAYAEAALAAVQGIATAVWNAQIERDGLGPAAARDWLADTRLMVGQLVSAPAAPVALSEADLARIVSAVVAALGNEGPSPSVDETADAVTDELARRLMS